MNIESRRYSKAPDGTLKVAEIFGPTFQGEGPSLGRRAAFVRLSGCNLECSWCDTPYHTDGHDMTTQQIVKEIASMAVDMVVITGGEPLLQQEALDDLLMRLSSITYRVELETNGTIIPRKLKSGLISHFNVSPKLSNARVSILPRKSTLMWFLQRPSVAFKFVVRDERDLEEVDALELPRHIVWIMPEGRTSLQVLETGRRIASAVLARGYNMTTRLQVLLWEDKRGV